MSQIWIAKDGLDPWYWHTDVDQQEPLAEGSSFDNISPLDTTMPPRFVTQLHSTRPHYTILRFGLVTPCYFSAHQICRRDSGLELGCRGGQLRHTCKGNKMREPNPHTHVVVLSKSCVCAPCEKADMRLYRYAQPLLVLTCSAVST